MNKSEAIRAYIAKKPDAGPKAISEALEKRGVEASIGLISQVKYNSATTTSKKTTSKEPTAEKKRGRPKGSGRPKKSTRQAASSNGQAAEALFIAKELSDRLGGVDRAQEALTILAKLTS